jgi:hypothetical protein
MYEVYVYRHDAWLYVDKSDDKAVAQALADRVGGVVIG